MGVQLNHAIVWSSDRRGSARFLAEMLGRPAPQAFGHFKVVALDNGVALDFADHGTPIQQQHYASLISEEQLYAVLARTRHDRAGKANRFGLTARYRASMTSSSASAAVAATRPLAVVYTPTVSLVPDPRNARTHPKRQVAQIVASIRAFGFTNPILADEQGRLIAGHGRLLAARECGLAKVPVITLAGLGEAQRKALRLADNKIALNAGWDVEILKLELADLALPEFDMDLSLTGFASGEIDVILADGADPDDEVIPPVPAEPRCRDGDIWQLGEHRIGCGDGRDTAFLQAIVGEGQAIDAAFLDPPYNVKINGHANARGRHREFAMASGEMGGREHALKPNYESVGLIDRRDGDRRYLLKFPVAEVVTNPLGTVTQDSDESPAKRFGARFDVTA